MDIAAIIHTHGQPNVTLDTIDSVRHYMTNKILVVVDDAGWLHFEGLNIPANKLRGFYHGFYHAPYRNVTLALLAAAQHFPNVDWYCYLEYDALVGSTAFKSDLELAAKANVWLLGNDYREHEEKKVQFPLIELILKEKINEIVYLLGAVLFYHRKFIDKCMSTGFFEKLLYYTNDFRNGFFPDYKGKAAWDLMEHVMPTLAKHWGGEVRQFAKWGQHSGLWSGNARRYPIRWQPELFLVEHEYLQAAIMHPLKSLDHPVRVFHRNKRNRRKNQGIGSSLDRENNVDNGPVVDR